ncbi:MAG: indolepyruvate ferredoxin oxidoreductase subunit alpha [Christensenellales bacterium]
MRNKQLLMGNEAAALGAVRAGISLASGYPGTPSTEALEYAAKHFGRDIHIEWSVNEKTALEVAAGASFAGARTLVTMKQVGLNVASDPLMSLRYVGLTGGMVVYVADDPGPISSQTEQDTRTFAMFSKTPIFDPSSPEELFHMMADAYALSERYQTPVLVRPTTRICHANAAIDADAAAQFPRASGEFARDGKRVIFPRTSFLAHQRIEEEMDALSGEFSNSPYNPIESPGAGRRAIAAGGVSYAYVKEALSLLGVDCPVLKIGTPYPFPERRALELLHQVDEVLVFEELDPVIERALLQICGAHRLPVAIRGKRDHTLPRAGEYGAELAAEAIAAFLGVAPPAAALALPEPPPLPVRPPVLCAGCPHRASFYAVKRAMKGKKAVFAGDIGCYTLGNAPPLNMTDTCLCMGAGITVAQGIGRVCPDTTMFSFTGDSTFFHTGIPGIANAVYNGADLIAVVLDNATTAMTGQQPNPATGFAANGEVAAKISIEAVLGALGVGDVQTVNPFDQDAATAAVKHAAQARGVRAIVFRAPCIFVTKPAAPYAVDPDVCIGCRACVREIGCPAIVSAAGKQVRIDPALCTGCGLCAGICPVGAIGGTDK